MCIFLSFLANEQTFFGFLLQISGSFFKTAFHVSKETLFWEKYLEKKFFSNTCSHWAKKLRPFVENVSAGLSKLLSSRPEEHSEVILLFEKNDLFNFW